MPPARLWRTCSAILLAMSTALALSACEGDRAPSEATTPTTLQTAGMQPVSKQKANAPSPSTSPYKGVGITPFPSTCGDVETVGAAWYYTWWHNARCPGSSAEFVPMLWGDWCPDGGDCSALPQQLVAEGATTVLGFNEPDSPEQSNMTVERALDLWAVLDKTPLRLGSPAVSWDPRDRADAWMDAFMAGANARGLRVDFVAVHWYGDCSSTAGLNAFLSEQARFGLPIWVTELSCWHQSQEANTSFAAQAIAEMAAMPSVERVAWFSNRPYPGGWEGTGLLDSAGGLSPVGRAYQSAPSTRTAPGR